MLSHEIGGRSGGPNLLLVHPMGATGAFWDACRAQWEGAFRCIVPDLRNAGASPASMRPLTIEDHARDLAALCERIGAERVIPVGCAVGAMVAAAFAGLDPERTAALVLANPGFRTMPEARAALEQRAADVRAGGVAAAVPSAIDIAFHGSPDDQRKQAYLRRFLAQDRERYALQIEGMLDADLDPHTANLSCPVLLVAGGADRLLPPLHAELLRARLPQAELVLFDDGAHLIPYQQPRRFALLVEDFLRRSGLDGAKDGANG